MRILEINLSERSSKLIDTRDLDYVVGGKPLAVELYRRYREAGEDVVVLATGPLATSPLPGTSIAVAVFKSPNNGGVGAAQVCGGLSPYMKSHGIDAIVLRGSSKNLLAVYVDGQSATFENVDALRSADTFTTLKSFCGEKYMRAAVVIGPAGEVGAAQATVVTESGIAPPSRHGLGAALGSVGVKALVIEPGPTSAFDDFAAVVDEVRWAVELCCSDFFGEVLRLGTLYEFNKLVEAGVVPWENMSGIYTGGEIDVEAADSVYSGGARSCIACPAPCVREFVLRPDGLWATMTLAEVVMLGTYVGIEDIELIARLSLECEKLGLDPLQTGFLLGAVMEGYESKVFPKDDIGYPVRFGAREAPLKFIRDLVYSSNRFFKLARAGLRELVKAYEKADHVVPHVNYTPIGFVDPRSEPALLLKYIISDAPATYRDLGKEPSDTYRDEAFRNAMLALPICDVFATDNTLAAYTRYLARVRKLSVGIEHLMNLGFETLRKTLLIDKETLGEKFPAVSPKITETQVPEGPRKGAKVKRKELKALTALIEKEILRRSGASVKTE